MGIPSQMPSRRRNPLHVDILQDRTLCPSRGETTEGGRAKEAQGGKAASSSFSSNERLRLKERKGQSKKNDTNSDGGGSDEEEEGLLIGAYKRRQQQSREAWKTDAKRRRARNTEEGDERTSWKHDGAVVEGPMCRRLLQAVDKQQQELLRDEEEDDDESKRCHDETRVPVGECKRSEEKVGRNGGAVEEEAVESDGGEEQGYVFGEDDEQLQQLLQELADGGRLSADGILRSCNETAVIQSAVTKQTNKEHTISSSDPNQQHSSGSSNRNLADIVMAKLAAREYSKDSHDDGVSTKGEEEEEEDTEVERVYRGIGEYLKMYKSGRIPKAFKVIPRLANWEEALYLTDPLRWTPQAMYEATKIFSSNFNPRMAQRFYNLVLLPAIREDIQANKRLHYHYYQAAKKAMFKPAAWFKGLLLPLVIEGCTLREVVIIGSILAKISVPVLHAAAALVRLCDIEPWEHTTAYFINVLLNKKFALPMQVVDRVVKHFCSFSKGGEYEESTLPVVWHKCLLGLVQRYKYDLTAEQRTALHSLLRVHFHHQIGPEVRRELQATVKHVAD